MSGSTGHIDNHQESIDKSMEEYRQQLLREGHFKEDSQEFNSLMMLHKFLETTPKEELDKIWKEIEDSGVGSAGPTVEEYFESLNPQAMYAKGYREGAARLKELLEEHFKNNEKEFTSNQILDVIKHVFENN